jgi:hypothetical protein
MVAVVAACGDSGGDSSGLTAATAATAAVPTAKMVEFVGYFGERGIIDSICAPDYSPFFEQAVGVNVGNERLSSFGEFRTSEDNKEPRLEAVAPLKVETINQSLNYAQ